MKKSQNNQVLEYLYRHGSITSLAAFRELGVTRLSGRIYDLRMSGFQINSEYVKVARRNGEETSVVKYSLVGRKQLELPL